MLNLYVSHRQFQHLDLNRKLAVPQTGVVLSVLCGQWQCYSELCSAYNVSIWDVAAFSFQFIWSLPLSLPPPPKIYENMQYLLLSCRKAQQVLIFLSFFFFYLTKVSAAHDAVGSRCLSLYFLWFLMHVRRKGSSQRCSQTVKH